MISKSIDFDIFFFCKYILSLKPLGLCCFSRFVVQQTPYVDINPRFCASQQDEEGGASSKKSSKRILDDDDEDSWGFSLCMAHAFVFMCVREWVCKMRVRLYWRKLRFRQNSIFLSLSFSLAFSLSLLSLCLYLCILQIWSFKQLYFSNES